jgi:putative Mn2+ efflux pump MntP
MHLFDIILIAIGLAMDAFAVAMAVGLHLSQHGIVSTRQYFRLSFHFGLFQFMMPIFGWLVGSFIAAYIQSLAHWLAGALLFYIGIRLIREGREIQEYHRVDPTRGLSLIILSIATSIDALAMGLSLAFLGSGIVYPSIIIGLVAGGFTIIGLYVGKSIGVHWRAKAALLGGIVLIGIGLKVIIEQL